VSKKRKRLEMTVGAIQRRWGLRALRRLEADPAKAAIPHISTGFPTLDKALDGIGGIPRSRLSELLGQPTSGMATLAPALGLDSGKFPARMAALPARTLLNRFGHEGRRLHCLGSWI
jgi:hypothetical protein